MLGTLNFLQKYATTKILNDTFFMTRPDMLVMKFLVIMFCHEVEIYCREIDCYLVMKLHVIVLKPNVTVVKSNGTFPCCRMLPSLSQRLLFCSQMLPCHEVDCNWPEVECYLVMKS